MVLRAFCRADVNSDFSANVDESIPYDLSSVLSSESFIDEMSGRLDMMVASVLIAPMVARITRAFISTARKPKEYQFMCTK